eukprot:m.311478 g.311478  ORF g.311478 m.311478 type:complete len:96 (+) comp27796_c0_seq1:390-677(+)
MFAEARETGPVNQTEAMAMKLLDCRQSVSYGSPVTLAKSLYLLSDLPVPLCRNRPVFQTGLPGRTFFKVRKKLLQKAHRKRSPCQKAVVGSLLCI